MKNIADKIYIVENDVYKEIKSRFEFEYFIHYDIDVDEIIQLKNDIFACINQQIVSYESR